MKKFKIIVVVLAALTILMLGITVYAYASEEPKTFCFYYLEAEELAQKPPDFIPENETFDPYVVEAIENLGTWVKAEEDIYYPDNGTFKDIDGIECTFDDLRNRYNTNNVEHGEKYYVVNGILADPPWDFFEGKPTLRRLVPISWTILVCAWVFMGVYTKKHKVKKEVASGVRN
jgi:hypothetical protein